MAVRGNERNGFAYIAVWIVGAWPAPWRDGTRRLCGDCRHVDGGAP